MSVRVGILGATGAVGQRLIRLLASHDRFAIAVVTASTESAGQAYDAAAKWRVPGEIPQSVKDMTVVETTPEAIPTDVPLLFSALPSAVADRVEPAFVEAGYVVSSNASNARLADDIPLIIPEVNADHLGLVDVQRDNRGWDGALVKNPNCSTITMVPPLAALSQFGLARVQVATLQAVSGAGYAGVTSMEIIDNVLPHIDGEEDKMESEPRKLLGEFDGAEINWHDVSLAASCNRVGTLDGHLENVWVETEQSITPDQAEQAFEAAPSMELPSAPETLIHVFDAPDRPQPRLDRNTEGGQAVAVGPVQQTPWGIQFDSLAHNTIRGAAGASLLNGELLLDQGYL